MARSWSEEACLHCKGYPGYDECTCTPLVKAKRAERRGNDDALYSRVGPAERAYLGRYDSPDNERDSMG